jgi:predicted ABC-type ATPase
MTLEPKPTLTVIAGPNGAGKSTFTNSVRAELRVPIIDPDMEARQIQPDNPEAAAIQAGRLALNRARAYLENNQSFAVETTLSGNTYLRMMNQAKSKGWQVNLIYVGVSNVQINIRRVAQRVSQGGHNVPEQDIRRRSERSLANFPAALQQADRALLFDNSKVAGHRSLLTIENGRVIEQAFDLPEWINAALPLDILQQSELDRQVALVTAACVQEMLSHLGSTQPDGSLIFAGRLLFTQQGDVITITNQEESREILRVEGERSIKFNPTQTEREQLGYFR